MAAKNDKTYGVVDVGSNSVRLSIYARSSGAYPLQKVFDEKHVVGLAAYVNDGVLSEKGVRVAAKAVNRQIAHAKLIGNENLRVFATAAMRNCTNSAEAVQLFSRLIGTPVDLITGPREAALGFAGMQPEVDLREGFVVDIGGGSTEISLVRAGKITASTSLPVGSLSLWSNHVAGIVPTRQEFENCRAQVRPLLQALDANEFPHQTAESGESGAATTTLYGIGGTIRTAAKAWAECATIQQAGDQRVSAPERLTRKHVEEVMDFALENPDAFGHMMARIEPTRIHTAATGMTMLIELLCWTGASALRPSKHGVREGYVLTCMM